MLSEPQNALRSQPRLSILYVSYPLLAISDESAGGAEQMLLTLEREMARAGHRTTVAACDGSRVHGRLLATGEPARRSDVFEQREREHCERILDYLRDHPDEFDLIHDESGSFFRHAARVPRARAGDAASAAQLLSRGVVVPLDAESGFNCVSQSQARTFADLPNLIGVVQNGIAVERFRLV